MTLLQAKLRTAAVVATMFVAASATVYGVFRPVSTVSSAAPPVAADTALADNLEIWSTNVFVRLSSDRTTLTGYSMKNGKSQVANVKNAADAFNGGVIVSDSIAGFVFEDQAWAFSADTGTWDSASIDVNSNDGITVASHYAMIHSGGSLLIFNANTGKWSDPIP